jgi:type II secretory pathway component HofQ
MCWVAAIPWIVAGIAAVGSYEQNKAQNRAIKNQQKALAVQNQVRQDEINQQTGNEVNEIARAARRERAAARVAASESGINLGSGSFLAMLQESSVNQSINSGLTLKNGANAQRARDASYRSNLAALVTKSGLGIALDAVGSGVSAYYGAGGTGYFGRQPGRG